MKPLSIPLLVVITVLSAVFGAMMMDTLATRGFSLPVTGWLTAIILAALGGVLLRFGIPLRRYMLECEERKEHPTLAPRRHHLDLPTAFRTVLLARACAYTGAVVGGLFTGQALYFLLTGVGDVVQAMLPTGVAAIAGIALGVLGVIVERWGKLPPQDGDGDASVQEGAGA